MMFDWPDFQSLADGVGRPGHAEPPFAAVRRARVRRAYTRPVRIEPEAGKATEDDVQAGSSNNDSCNVLQHDDAGS
jgi:hypothetical protein